MWHAAQTVAAGFVQARFAFEYHIAPRLVTKEFLGQCLNNREGKYEHRSVLDGRSARNDASLL